jgi:hypothetical protein
MKGNDRTPDQMVGRAVMLAKLESISATSIVSIGLQATVRLRMHDSPPAVTIVIVVVLVVPRA